MKEKQINLSYLSKYAVTEKIINTSKNYKVRQKDIVYICNCDINI